MALSLTAGEVSQNSILRMSDDKTMQLIKLYEKEECLWNTSLDDYKNRDKRAKAAENIAKELNVKHFEARHVIIKFKNLRNSYCQELKKIAHSLNAGLGDEEVYRPRVFWFSKMDSFLRPHLQPSRASQSGFVPDLKIKKEPENDVEEWVQMSNPEDVIPKTEINEDSSSELEQESNPEHRRSSTSSKRKMASKTKMATVKKTKMDDDCETNVQITQNLREISNQLHILTSQNDYFDNFGRYIASLLRSLPQEVSFTLQPKIVSLITLAGLPDGSVTVSQSDDSGR